LPSLGIVLAQDAILARLTAAGIRAATDERDLNPPCVLVGPPVLAFRFGRPGWDGEFRLIAVVPDSGRDTATAALDELVGAVAAALGGALLAGTPTQLSGLDGAPPLPAYELTMNTHARKAT
jgi:hypothetical protein